MYALLPIVRSTYAGIIGIDRHLLEIAFVLGLGRLARLIRIELPLASISIMVAIKTSAVMTVGTATLAAFIGGGGYGALIVRGLALDNTATIWPAQGPPPRWSRHFTWPSSFWTASPSRVACAGRRLARGLEERVEATAGGNDFAVSAREPRADPLRPLEEGQRW